MSRNPSVSLTEHQQNFVAGLIESGRYRGVSEVFRAGLRMLEEQEERRRALLRRLESGVQDGLDSGPAAPMETMTEIIAEARRGAGSG